MTTAFAIPFLVGLTGHRDLRSEDLPALRSILADQLATLVKSAGDTPVWLVSGLAAGADQLATGVALERGLTVVAAPPVPWDIYRADFSDPEWDALLRLRECCRELPALAPERLPTEDDAAWRARGYILLGEYLARSCPLLIAVWDGVEGLSHAVAAKPGGTAAVLRAHLRGSSASSGPQALDLAPLGVAVHVHAWRTSRDPRPETTLGRVEVLGLRDPTEDARLPEASAEDGLRAWLQRLVQLNRDLGQLPADAVETSRGYLVGEAQHGLHAPGLQPAVESFACLDALAGRLQAQHQGRLPKPPKPDMGGFWSSVVSYWRSAPPIGFLQTILGLGLAGLLVQQFRQTIAPESTLVLALSMALLAGAYLAFVIGWRRDVQGRYLDYRAIAEGLRVAVFWRVAGINEQVADHYLHRQRGSGDWVRYILHAAVLQVACDPRSRLAKSSDPRLAIAERWIADQAGYFASSAGRDTWNLQRLKRWAIILFWTGLAAGPLATLVPTLAGVVSIGIAAQFMAGTLAAFAATLALDEHAQSYGRMREIFFRAKTLAGESMDLAVLTRELGREAMAENATWLTLHRSRPPSFGKSGSVIKATKAFEGAAQRLLVKEAGRLSR